MIFVFLIHFAGFCDAKNTRQTSLNHEFVDLIRSQVLSTGVVLAAILFLKILGLIRCWDFLGIGW